MKIFQQAQVREATAYAAAGGQALHLFSGAIADAIGAVRKIPNCFRGRKELDHLFDQDTDRLRKTARRLGVRVIFVHHAGEPRQHIDLCGGPLELAKAHALTVGWIEREAAGTEKVTAVCPMCSVARRVLNQQQIGMVCPECGGGAHPGFKQQILGEFWDRLPANSQPPERS